MSDEAITRRSWLVEYVRPIPSDIRSGLVGAAATWIAGGILLVLSTQCASPRPKEFTTPLNANGESQPLPILTRLLERETAGATVVRFVPESVQQAYVCEFARLKAETAQDLLFDYIDRYNMCFNVRALSEREFVISSNMHSGQMIERDGTWHCRCQAN